VRKWCWMLISLLAADPALGNSNAVDGWAAWQRGLDQKCPERHVEWLCDGCYLDYLDDFTKTLSPRVQRHITELAYHPNRCAYERMGFSCEMSVTLTAIEKLRLMGLLTDFSCRHYQCDDPSNCRRS
jgi:hypothetical protein